MANDTDNLLGVLKKIVLDVNEASKPVNVVFGTVVSDSPLKIQISQKLTLNKKQLVLTRNVTDYKVFMTVNHKTENKGCGSSYSAFSSHNHDYKGTKEFLIHNNLKTGDKVLMIRMQEGQKYIVIDRVV